jgi:hypothetical protein
MNSGVDFKKTFGTASAATPKANARDERPKAQFWLNIGYQAGVVLEGEDEPRFISLPVGIPLDNVEPLPVNSRNATWAAQQQARNALHDQIVDLAKTLAPGETRILNLQIELRHVNDEAPTVAAHENPFLQPLSL